MTETKEVTVLYTDVHTVQHQKKISIPEKRFGLGITKVREGYVLIGWFPSNPRAVGYESYQDKLVRLPEITGHVRLKVGNRIISKSK